MPTAEAIAAVAAQPDIRSFTRTLQELSAVWRDIGERPDSWKLLHAVFCRAAALVPASAAQHGATTSLPAAGAKALLSEAEQRTLLRLTGDLRWLLSRGFAAEGRVYPGPPWLKGRLQPSWYPAEAGPNQGLPSAQELLDLYRSLSFLRGALPEASRWLIGAMSSVAWFWRTLPSVRNGSTAVQAQMWSLLHHEAKVTTLRSWGGLPTYAGSTTSVWPLAGIATFLARTRDPDATIALLPTLATSHLDPGRKFAKAAAASSLHLALSNLHLAQPNELAGLVRLATALSNGIQVQLASSAALRNPHGAIAQGLAAVLSYAWMADADVPVPPALAAAVEAGEVVADQPVAAGAESVAGAVEPLEWVLRTDALSSEDPLQAVDDWASPRLGHRRRGRRTALAYGTLLAVESAIVNYPGGLEAFGLSNLRRVLNGTQTDGSIVLPRLLASTRRLLVDQACSLEPGFVSNCLMTLNKPVVNMVHLQTAVQASRGTGLLHGTGDQRPAPLADMPSLDATLLAEAIEDLPLRTASLLRCLEATLTRVDHSFVPSSHGSGIVPVAEALAEPLRSDQPPSLGLLPAAAIEDEVTALGGVAGAGEGGSSAPQAVAALSPQQLTNLPFIACLRTTMTQTMGNCHLLPIAELDNPATADAGGAALRYARALSALVGASDLSFALWQLSPEAAKATISTRPRPLTDARWPSSVVLPTGLVVSGWDSREASSRKAAPVLGIGNAGLFDDWQGWQAIGSVCQSLTSQPTAPPAAVDRVVTALADRVCEGVERGEFFAARALLPHISWWPGRDGVARSEAGCVGHLPGLEAAVPPRPEGALAGAIRFAHHKGSVQSRSEQQQYYRELRRALQEEIDPLEHVAAREDLPKHLPPCTVDRNGMPWLFTAQSAWLWMERATFEAAQMLQPMVAASTLGTPSCRMSHAVNRLLFDAVRGCEHVAAAMRDGCFPLFETATGSMRSLQRLAVLEGRTLARADMDSGGHFLPGGMQRVERGRLARIAQALQTAANLGAFDGASGASGASVESQPGTPAPSAGAREQLRLPELPEGDARLGGWTRAAAASLGLSASEAAYMDVACRQQGLQAGGRIGIPGDRARRQLLSMVSALRERASAGDCAAETALASLHPAVIELADDSGGYADAASGHRFWSRSLVLPYEERVLSVIKPSRSEPAGPRQVEDPSGAVGVRADPLAAPSPDPGLAAVEAAARQQALLGQACDPAGEEAEARKGGLYPGEALVRRLQGPDDDPLLTDPARLSAELAAGRQAAAAYVAALRPGPRPAWMRLVDLTVGCAENLSLDDLGMTPEAGDEMAELAGTAQQTRRLPTFTALWGHMVKSRVAGIGTVASSLELHEPGTQRALSTACERVLEPVWRARDTLPEAQDGLWNAAVNHVVPGVAMLSLAVPRARVAVELPCALTEAWRHAASSSTPVLEAAQIAASASESESVARLGYSYTAERLEGATRRAAAAAELAYAQLAPNGDAHEEARRNGTAVWHAELAREMAAAGGASPAWVLFQRRLRRCGWVVLRPRFDDWQACRSEEDRAALLTRLLQAEVRAEGLAGAADA